MYFAKQLKEEQLVSAGIAKAIQREPRLEAVIDGLKWRIAQDPYAGSTKIVRNGFTWLGIKAPCYGPGGRPLVTLLYSASEHEIHIVSFKVDWPAPKKGS